MAKMLSCMLACISLIVGANAFRFRGGLPPSFGALAGSQGAQANQTGLIAISHYVPGDLGEADRRNVALKRTVAAMLQWPNMSLTIYLVTNKIVEEVKGMITMQVVVGEDSTCAENITSRFCVPWEAIRVLRSASSGEPPTTRLGVTVMGEPRFDVFVYTESDILIPEDTFRFWHGHVDSLYKRGYLLLPLREERTPKGDVFVSGCFERQCVNRTEVLTDEQEGVVYSSTSDRHYLRPYNPYSACFMMSKGQFRDYLSRRMWDYGKVLSRKYSPWPLRETAASGLLWAPGFGKHAGLTHLKMRVWHQLPEHGRDPSSLHKVDDYSQKILECSDGEHRCPLMAKLFRANRRKAAKG